MSMFGGAGVYFDARFFAIIFGDALYFKAKRKPGIDQKLFHHKGTKVTKKNL
jgi:TfoX/Sxy family transcriptional regulator of competence genes